MLHRNCPSIGVSYDNQRAQKKLKTREGNLPVAGENATHLGYLARKVLFIFFECYTG